MEAKLVYQMIATAVQARKNCAASGNQAWFGKWTDKLEELQGLLPSGAGFDCGSNIDIESCTPTLIVLYTQFHHMNEAGMYDGWTEHRIAVTPTFDGIDLSVEGEDRNDILDYIGELFHDVLTQEV